ncbi:hypothetical protein STRDD11_00522 [Streptococcus sp. DD11]|nr:hypothetical protein STRDD11_00522 [Streptococcus sp. DD11]
MKIISALLYTQTTAAWPCSSGQTSAKKVPVQLAADSFRPRLFRADFQKVCYD